MCGVVVVIPVLIIDDHFTDEETEVLLLGTSAAKCIKYSFYGVACILESKDNLRGEGRNKRKKP